MLLRSPVRRLTLMTVASVMALAGLRIALKGVDPNSEVHRVLAVSGMIVALAVVGFAWSLASALLADRRARR